MIEKGDSIALAVANTKYFIHNDTVSQRPEFILNLIKGLIVYESFERENIKKILHDLKKNSNVLISNNQNMSV